MTSYDYTLIANLNLNIRVERFRIMDPGFGDPLALTDIPYTQVQLTEDEMAALILGANAMAENVTLYVKAEAPVISANQLAAVHVALQEALTTLLDHLPDAAFQRDRVQVLQPADPENRASGLNSYVHVLDDGAFQTKVYLTYMPNILSSIRIFPIRPGAVINDFSILTY
ncbi:hypothetical protein [Lacticaseibacillus mingshuiensis]|uniref:hypothetical protein n=1 Tax=Lacticaseibacillus mingshuiensis TaxID=2799574 RepID=UPI00194F842A|nr:hypothetical protein [Lacticaseibacillus mingshuiensis]